jgi:catechol 2,3-dioxygenase-like lactoylglutathione lyase family enzyme
MPKLPSNGLTFNHAMIYARDVGRAVHFYCDLLGFRLLEEFRHQDFPVYARLRSPRGTATIALHLAERGQDLPDSGGIRLYFEVKNLAVVCKKLGAAGMEFSQLPKKMPWGWDHAYLKDPDGHELSLYWAGEKRLRKVR